MESLVKLIPIIYLTGIIVTPIVAFSFLCLIELISFTKNINLFITNPSDFHKPFHKGKPRLKLTKNIRDFNNDSDQNGEESFLIFFGFTFLWPLGVVFIAYLTITELFSMILKSFIKKSAFKKVNQ